MYQQGGGGFFFKKKGMYVNTRIRIIDASIPPTDQGFVFSTCVERTNTVYVNVYICIARWNQGVKNISLPPGGGFFFLFSL